MSAISLNMRKHYGPLLNGFIIFHFQINTEGCLNNLNQTLLKSI